LAKLIKFWKIKIATFVFMENIEIKNYLRGFEGEIEERLLYRRLYATDASVYKEYPRAVVYPKTYHDLHLLVKMAQETGIPLIPRGAGTSLAGQVVGNGVVIDFSKHLTKILEVNTQECWVRVQPGVILDELNRFLKPFGLFFSPETSTSSRCTLGGMLGNNSCGSHSLVYGSTRDHVLEVDAILSDGSEVCFKPLTLDEFNQKLELSTLEGEIYRNIYAILSNSKHQELIRKNFPHPEIRRRNAGYALDILLDTEPFGGTGPFNFAKLIAGSEGTLALVKEIKLNLVELPPSHMGVVCVHCRSLEEALEANLVALECNPVAVELMDNEILSLASANPLQKQNRSFVVGEPAAILIVEFAEHTDEDLLTKAHLLENKLRERGMGYHYPLLIGKESQKVWDLRKAGLGVLTNMPGDAKPVAVIEDTAVRPLDLPAFIKDIQAVLNKFNLSCVYYAHIGTGELHLRPVLNLKDPEDVKKFREIAYEVAYIVKKYRGSISGEHGDGRLRAELLPIVFGDEIIQLFRSLKRTWDFKNIFNPGKILDAPPLNTYLRFEPGQPTPEVKTFFDFSEEGGILRSVEKCNGSGDCRKPHTARGGMCPSYQATWDEKNSTRARANTLREILTGNQRANPFNHSDLYEILDLCLSCKLCKKECPSNIDMATYKAEFLQHWYDAHGIPFRTLAIAYFDLWSSWMKPFAGIYNWIRKSKAFSSLALKAIGFSTKRELPPISPETFHQWARKHLAIYNELSFKRKLVFLFVDEFTNHQDVELGKTAVKLLTALGYQIKLLPHRESARTFLSKGMLKKAKEIIDFNIATLAPWVSDETPLVGIEPSAILGFRDEYPRLCTEELRPAARYLSKHALLIDELLVRDFELGFFSRDVFTDDKKVIHYHGHCQQKALVGTEVTKKLLSIPRNYEVKEIPSGCCGMAGSFGYEKEHYELSMKVGELVLFPAVRKASQDEVIAASGTSCRQQIKDGTGRRALHPIQILYEALINK
jgi:FAD/FMN-containing dehydrogenase/Fe-S oxidoreductase